MRPTTTFCRLAAAVLAALCVVPGSAGAAETAAPPSHLKAYGLDWLNYIDPADVPPTRYATCLVDSGVRETPDTPATSADGPIIARLAVDGGPGEPEGDSEAQLHGTEMAMAMAAPVNDWGTIGAWTGSRVVSVRATTAGEDTFRPDMYQRGINRCIQFAADEKLHISAINLSLGCGDCALSGDQEAILEDWVGTAHKYGMSVIAAAGNTGGAGQTPASVVGVFSVAGGDHQGSLCSYSSFDSHVALIGPACPVELAQPQTGEPASFEGGGSSAATAVTSTLINVIRTLRPEATWDQVERWVLQSARTVDGHSVLDGRAAARAAGLENVIARADVRQTATTTQTTDPDVDPSGQSPSPPPLLGGREPTDEGLSTRLPRPKVALAIWKRHRLIVQVLNRPTRTQLLVVAEKLKPDGLRVRSSRRLLSSSARISARTTFRPGRLRIRLLPAHEADKRSLSRQVLLYRHGRRYR